MLSSVLEMTSVPFLKKIIFYYYYLLLLFISKGFCKGKINTCSFPTEAVDFCCCHACATLKRNGGSSACTSSCSSGRSVWQKWCTIKYSTTSNIFPLSFLINQTTKPTSCLDGLLLYFNLLFLIQTNGTLCSQEAVSWRRERKQQMSW